MVSKKVLTMTDIIDDWERNGVDDEETTAMEQFEAGEISDDEFSVILRRCMENFFQALMQRSTRSI